jgi:DNA repair exonuclease SbcCD ATPase subunit
MSRRLRSQKEEESGIEQVLERMVKGMRNEMNTVIWKIERSRDVSPEAVKNMVRNGLDSMVGAVEKVLYGVSDGLAKERKEKEQREDDAKWRSVRDIEIREERRRKEEEKVRKLEAKLERMQRENEDRWRERDERLKVIEDVMEKQETELKTMKEKVKASENMIREGERPPDTQKEDREAHARIDEMEKGIAKDRAERQEFEWSVEGDKGIQDAKDSEKDMEKKLEGAMEQVKILNVDLGKECSDRKALIKEAVSRIKETVTKNDRQEFDEILRGATVEVLGRSTTTKVVGEGRIYTVPILITCGCKNVKGRLERIVRNAGLVASFQWPKESMEFVEKIREKVEAMGFGRKEFFTRIRPVMKEGKVLLRADTKRKEGGKFEGLAYWRAPPMDKEYWSRINSMMEPERLIAKQVESIGL